MANKQAEISFSFHKARFGADVTGISVQVWRLTHLSTDQLVETKQVTPGNKPCSIVLAVDGRVDIRLAYVIFVVHCHWSDGRPSCPIGELRLPLECLLSKDNEDEVNLLCTSDAGAAHGLMHVYTTAGAVGFVHSKHMVQWSTQEDVPVEEVEEELQLVEGADDPALEPSPVQVDMMQVDAWDIHEAAAEYVGACPFDASFGMPPSIDHHLGRTRDEVAIQERINRYHKDRHRNKVKQARMVKGVAGCEDDVLEVIGKVVGQQNVISVQRIQCKPDNLRVLRPSSPPVHRQASLFSPSNRDTKPEGEGIISTEQISSGGGKSDFLVLLNSKAVAEKLVTEMADTIAEQQWEISELTAVEEQFFENLEPELPPHDEVEDSEVWLAMPMNPREDEDDISDPDAGPRSPTTPSPQLPSAHRRKQNFCPALNRRVDSLDFTSQPVRDLELSIRSQDSLHLSCSIEDSFMKVEQLGTGDSPKKVERFGIHPRRYVKGLYADSMEKAVVERSEPVLERFEALEETWGRAGVLQSLTPDPHPRPRSGWSAVEDLVLHSKPRPPTANQSKELRSTRQEVVLSQRSRQGGESDWYLGSSNNSEPQLAARALPEGRQETDFDIAEMEDIQPIQASPALPFTAQGVSSEHIGGGGIARGACLHLQEPVVPHIATRSKRRQPHSPKGLATTKYFTGVKGPSSFQDWSLALRTQAGDDAILWTKEIIVGDETDESQSADILQTSCYAARFRNTVGDDAFRVLRSEKGQEWQCYADTVEEVEEVEEELQDLTRPRRPRTDGMPCGPYCWMGVDEVGVEVVLQVVEVRCMERPSVLHVTFVSEVDDIASSSLSEEEPPPENEVVSPNGHAGPGGASISGRWTPLSGRSSKASEPRSRRHSTGSMSCDSSASLCSATENPADSFPSQPRAAGASQAPCVLQYFTQTAGEGSLQRFSDALKVAVGDEALVWVEEICLDGADAEDIPQGSCRGPCFAAKVRQTQSQQALDVLDDSNGAVWTNLGTMDDAVEDEVEQHLERRRQGRAGKAGTQVWRRVAIEGTGQETVLEEVVPKCMAGPPVLFVAFVSEVADDTAQDVDWLADDFPKQRNANSKQHPPLSRAVYSTAFADEAQVRLPMPGDRCSDHSVDMAHLVPGDSTLPAVLQWLASSETPRDAAAPVSRFPVEQRTEGIIINNARMPRPLLMKRAEVEADAAAAANSVEGSKGSPTKHTERCEARHRCVTAPPATPGAAILQDTPSKVEAAQQPPNKTAVAEEWVTSSMGPAQVCGRTGPALPVDMSTPPCGQLLGKVVDNKSYRGAAPGLGSSLAAPSSPPSPQSEATPTAVALLPQPFDTSSSSTSLQGPSVSAACPTTPHHHLPTWSIPPGRSIPHLLLDPQHPTSDQSPKPTFDSDSSAQSDSFRPSSALGGEEAEGEAEREGQDSRWSRSSSTRWSTPQLPALNSRRSSQASAGQTTGLSTGRSGTAKLSSGRQDDDLLQPTSPGERSPFNPLLSFSDMMEPPTTSCHSRHKQVDNMLSTSSGWIQGWDCHTVSNPDQLQIMHLTATSVKVAWRRPENAGSSVPLQYKVLLSADKGKTFHVVGVVAETEVGLQNLLANTLYHVSVSTVLPEHFSGGMGCKPPSQRAKILHFHTKPVVQASGTTGGTHPRLATPRLLSPAYRQEGDASTSLICRTPTAGHVLIDQVSPLKKKPISHQRVHPYSTPPTLPRITK